jgi:NhaA family Na+:H+ antiporter
MDDTEEPDRPHSPLGRLVDFFRGGEAGGLVLMLSAAAAVAWANSPWQASYEHLVHLPVVLTVGKRGLHGSTELIVNDALMAIFFLLIGLEIRRELVEGQLATVRRAAAPALAALGGMALPALIYLGFTHADPGATRGWAIAIATDIAFSLAVLRVMGRRVPAGLRVFLTALAIIDDLGAIVVIAVFYTDAPDLTALGLAGAIWVVLAVLARAGMRKLGPYLVGFAAMWVALAFSGIHPTLAGVAVAFAVPMRAENGSDPAYALEHELLGWVAYLVLPLFGLANAGLRLGGFGLHQLTDPVVLGITLGLVLGKPAGVVGFTWAGVRTGLVRLPAQLSWPLLIGAGMLCGIGFTMGLFIGHLAFPTGEREAELKLAIFVGSIISAGAGLYALSRASRKARSSQTVETLAPQTSAAKP